MSDIQSAPSGDGVSEKINSNDHSVAIQASYDLSRLRTHHTTNLNYLKNSIANLVEVDTVLTQHISAGELELKKAKNLNIRDPKLEVRLASAIKNFIVTKRKGEKTMAEYTAVVERVKECLEVVGMFERIQECVQKGDEKGGRLLLFEAMASGKSLL